MLEYSILEIPTILIGPVSLEDIICNCPVCDYEIDVDVVVDDNSFIKCDNCDHIVKLKIKKID